MNTIILFALSLALLALTLRIQHREENFAVTDADEPLPSDLAYADCLRCAKKTVSMFHIPRATEAICKSIPSGGTGGTGGMKDLHKRCLAGDTSQQFVKDYAHLLLTGYGQDACRICPTSQTH